jgi:hypothetical protein
MFVPALLLALLSTAAFADGSSKVTITSPANGATVGQHDDVSITYEAALGADGDHIHVYLDGKRVDVVHTPKGTTSVGMLSPGKHHICMVVNTKGHVADSPEGCVDVTAQ